jgi:hypothetical protein
MLVQNFLAAPRDAKSDCGASFFVEFDVGHENVPCIFDGALPVGHPTGLEWIVTRGRSRSLREFRPKPAV